MEDKTKWSVGLSPLRMAVLFVKGLWLHSPIAARVGCLVASGQACGLMALAWGLPRAGWTHSGVPMKSFFISVALAWALGASVVMFFRKVQSNSSAAFIALGSAMPILGFLIWCAQEGSPVAAAAGGVDAAMSAARFEDLLVQVVVLLSSLVAALCGSLAAMVETVVRLHLRGGIRGAMRRVLLAVMAWGRSLFFKIAKPTDEEHSGMEHEILDGVVKTVTPGSRSRKRL